MVNSFTSRAPTPLDALVEYICINRFDIGEKILEDILDSLPLPYGADEIKKVCGEYLLPSLPRRTGEEALAIANVQARRGVNRSSGSGVSVYKYAAYTCYRALLREIDDREKYISESLFLVKNGYIKESHVWTTTNVIDDVREIVESKRKLLRPMAENAVAVCDVITALDDVHSCSVDGSESSDVFRRLAYTYAVRTCRGAGGWLGSVREYVRLENHL